MNAANQALRFPIERLAGKAEGRAAGSAFGPFIFIATVAHDRSAGFAAQVDDVLARLDGQLRELGGERSLILSATIYLADMGLKESFDRSWIEWIGPDPRGWPQRACVGATLAGDTLVEISVIAARRSFVAGRSDA